MKAYKPKYAVGDIVKFQGTGFYEHDLIIDVYKANGETLYNVLTLDFGRYDEDICCDDYDKQSIKVA